MSRRIPKRPAVPASEAQSPDPQFQPSGSIVGNLMQTFFQWVSTVWVEQESVPSSPEDLAQFDLASLIPEYHAYIAAGGKVDTEHGITMEQAWLSSQLVERKPLVCVVNTLQPPQPGARISRLLPLEGGQIIELLQRLFRHPQDTRKPWPGHPVDTPVAVGVYDGDRIMHQIVLLGTDTSSGNFVYKDPWPNRSLLCAENNSAGVAAEQVASGEHLWLLSPPAMESVIQYVLVLQHEINAIEGSAAAEGVETDLAEIEGSNFFQWFHLERVGFAMGEQARAFYYRPSGPNFRDAVMVTLSLVPGQGLLAARLILHRGFIDSPRDGVFAADMAKSFLLFAAGDEKAQMQALADEIYKPNATSIPTPGFLVFRGQQSQYEDRVGHRKLIMTNQETDGSPQLAITIFLTPVSHPPA